MSLHYHVGQIVDITRTGYVQSGIVIDGIEYANGAPSHSLVYMII